MEPAELGLERVGASEALLDGGTGDPTRDGEAGCAMGEPAWETLLAGRRLTGKRLRRLLAREAACVDLIGASEDREVGLRLGLLSWDPGVGTITHLS